MPKRILIYASILIAGHFFAASAFAATWKRVGKTPKSQIVPSGTWTPPSGVTLVWVTMCGGGGGGGAGGVRFGEHRRRRRRGRWFFPGRRRRWRRWSGKKRQQRFQCERQWRRRRWRWRSRRQRRRR